MKVINKKDDHTTNKVPLRNKNINQIVGIKRENHRKKEGEKGKYGRKGERKGRRKGKRIGGRKSK